MFDGISKTDIIAMKNERGFILAKFMFADKWKAREEWR